MLNALLIVGSYVAVSVLFVWLLLNMDLFIESDKVFTV